MKKKIIVSLILAMCCIMASIPASAADTCDECGPYFYWCRSLYENATSSHYVYDEGGMTGAHCYFDIRVYEAMKVCEECATETFHRTHGHGRYNHSYCGAANSEGCSLGY